MMQWLPCKLAFEARCVLQPGDRYKMGYIRDGKNRERGLELLRQEIRD